MSDIPPEEYSGPQPHPNPYIGPRAFQRGEQLYGRDQEVMELLDLLIAERIVLLYSPSGAGKTSLIEAALVPKLEEEGFRVLPPMRVSLEPPPLPDQLTAQSTNRYILSLLLSLEERLAEDEQTPLRELANLTLGDYLEQCGPPDQGDNVVLIFDQFEEVLTVDSTDRAVKAEFFEQVGTALRDRRRWALFAMREEFLAGLDPYLRPVPTRLSSTYRLELLRPTAARPAIQRPAREAGVDFTDAAATKLVDDLRRVRVQRPDGTTEEQVGIYVEPVQLQVVCRRLWDRLPPSASQIVAADVEEVGDVDSALAGYYADRVLAIATETGVPERATREWFDRQLITEQGIRGQVLQGPEQSQGLDNRAIWPLVDAHLVRAEKRLGATWFELAHDRLIDPVRADNAAWWEAHLHPLQRQAALWETEGRPGGLLWRDQVLVEAEAWAKAHEAELTSGEREFLEASRQARAIAERERRQARRIRWLAVGATIFSVVAIVLAVFAGYQMRKAQTSATAEATAKFAAEARLSEAQTAEVREVEARQLAEELQATLAVNLAILLDLQVAATETASSPSSTVPPAPSSVTSAVTSTPPPSRESTAAAALATVQAVQTQLAWVQATQTAAAVTPTPSVLATQASAAVTPTPSLLASNVLDFGSSQGARGWKYLVEEGRGSGRWLEMSFGEYEGKECWLTGTEGYVRICYDGEVHPGDTTRVAYEWQSEVDRDVQIRIHAYNRDTSCGDGVTIESFTVNQRTGRNEGLGKFGIRPDDQVGITEAYVPRVTPDTLLYVVIDIVADPGCDATQVEVEVD